MVLYWLVVKAVMDVLGKEILMIYIHLASYLLYKVGCFVLCGLPCTRNSVIAADVIMKDVLFCCSNICRYRTHKCKPQPLYLITIVLHIGNISHSWHLLEVQHLKQNKNCSKLYLDNLGLYGYMFLSPI